MIKTPNEIVRTYIRLRNFKQAAFAPSIGVTQSGLSKLLASNDMTVGQLFKLSVELQHDFFKDMSDQLPKEIRAKYTEEISLRDLIQEEIKKLK